MSTTDPVGPDDRGAKIMEGLDAILMLGEQLNSRLVERDVEIDLALIALVARQHMLLLGEPGTAKSMLARLVATAVEGSYFELLLTKFTEPSEVFGPLSVKRLVSDEVYERKVDRYLPSAEIAFLDEIFKSSSAIMNSLLTLVNEREFDNAGRRVPVPLQTMFAASNELPQDASLGALYDRFLIRTEVVAVSDPLALFAKRPEPSQKLIYLPLVQKAATRVGLPPEVQQAMVAIRNEIARLCHVKIGDRRFQQSASLLRASALIAGRGKVTDEDLWVLAYCYWQTPDQIPTAKRVVVEVAHALAATSAAAARRTPPSTSDRSEGGPGGPARPRTAPRSTTPAPPAPTMPTPSPEVIRRAEHATSIILNTNMAPDPGAVEDLYNVVEAIIDGGAYRPLLTDVARFASALFMANAKSRTFGFEFEPEAQANILKWKTVAEALMATATPAERDPRIVEDVRSADEVLNPFGAP